MTLDTTKMARFAASSIDELEQTKELAGGELGEILIVAEIKNIPLDEEDGGGVGTSVRYACTDDRYWVARGLLESALDSI